MEIYLGALIKACERLGIGYRFHDRAHNLIELACGEGLLFQLNRTPFNSEVMAQICRDKEHSYDLLHGRLAMPTSYAFIDFDVPAAYQHYVQHRSAEAVADAIEAQLDYPLVIKPNKGALGINVLRCNERAEVLAAIARIFDHQSQFYDYALLAQEYIPAQREFRVVCFRGQALFAYERVTGNAEFGARYWETQGGQAVPLDEPELIARIEREMAPALSLPGLDYVGLDVLLNPQNELYLLELNSAPKYNHFIQSNGDAQVVALYERILASYVRP